MKFMAWNALIPCRIIIDLYAGYQLKTRQTAFVEQQIKFMAAEAFVQQRCVFLSVPYENKGFKAAFYRIQYIQAFASVACLICFGSKPSYVVSEV